MKVLRNCYRHILLLVLLFTITVFSETIDDKLKDNMAQFDKKDSIEFTEVIKDVFVDESEHNLIINSGSFTSAAYRDTSAVLQLIDITKDFRWAIIISMPAEIGGRAETSYLLIDIKNRENVNAWLETETGRYIDGNYMEFIISSDGKTILNCEGYDGENYEIELK